MQANENTPSAGGMTAAQAKAVEYTIVGFSVLSLVLVFQPFSLTLFTVGAALVVFHAADGSDREARLPPRRS